jgi:isocitrate dehydrogenase (NAD+)
MSRPVVFIQGGGIGLAQEAAVRRILRAAGIADDWQVFPAGVYALEQGREPLAKDLLDAIRASGIALKTKIIGPATGRPPNYNVLMRKELGLFAAVRPIRNIQGLAARFHNVDILLIREITEDLYASIEHEIVPGVVESIKVVTEAACRRLFRFAFELATKLNRRTIHCIHKANILKMADGLFLSCFRDTARDYPRIAAKDLIVDNSCMQLVSRPQQFDVMVAGNLYGDLLSDLGTGLVGGISAAVGINYGDGLQVFECIHGSAAETVPPDRVNPLPLLFAVIEMLKSLDQGDEAARLQAVIERVLEGGVAESPDYGLSISADDFIDRVVSELNKRSSLAGANPGRAWLIRAASQVRSSDSPGSCPD